MFSPARSTAFIPMLLVLFSCLLLAGCAGQTYRDRVIPPMEEVEAMLAFMDEDLQLSQEQAIQIRAIIVENAGIKQNIGLQYRGRPMDVRDAQGARLDKFARKVEALLTPGQRKQFTPMMRAIQRRELQNEAGREIQPMRTPGDASFDGFGGY